MGKEVAMDFDLSSLPASMAQRLHNLINETNFFEIPIVNDLHAGPDEYEYVITVVAGNAVHTVHATDSSMPKSLPPLIDELTELAKTTT
jgi:emfourin